MSILRKPYEISVWDDIWDSGKGKFVESRLGIIGSDTMETQSRVIEPELTRNTNGTKKFSFKLYKRYIDNITGELVENPFYSWLINERKVKLKYDGKWYDFIVKNISETSTNYLYSYQLEDAIVKELSKNGFNFVFDEELKNNNGTAPELATKLLVDTDWIVDAQNSDVAIQKIEEALVYVQTTKEIKATQIFDPVQNKDGVWGGVSYNGKTIPSGTTVLAAYSSCTGRPHRFQFFWVEGMSNNESLVEDVLEFDVNRNITNKDCQYFVDCNDPKNDYPVVSTDGYCVPQGFAITTMKEDVSDDAGVSLSIKCRGKRYGFSQQSKYFPNINKYAKKYYDKEDTNSPKEEIFCCETTEYCSPIILQNILSGTANRRIY